MVKVIVGMMGSSVGGGSKSMAAKGQVQEFLGACKAHGVKELDTARVYNGGRSEELLGEAGAQKDFLIATKAPGFAPKALTEQNILSNSKKSHEALQQDKLYIYYIHGPGRDVSLEEQCRAFGSLYKEGKYERFGISNLTADEVEKIYNICKREGYCLPSVYQGGYNPVHRQAEVGLFPILKKLNMSFYAYSPLAGGLLAKHIDDLLNPKDGERFKDMPVFGDIYLKPNIIAALKKQTALGDAQGISIMENTLRWFMHHSPLGEEDGIILGASRTAQIEASLSACEKGPLPEDLVQGWDELWQAVLQAGEALPYHC